MTKAKVVVGFVAAMLLMAAPAEAHLLPVATWQLNETKGSVAHDSLGNDDGSLQGAAEWADGRFSGGVNFDGGAIVVRNAKELEPSVVSVSAWVNSDGSPGLFKHIVAKGGNGCSAASYAFYTGANGGLAFYASSNSGLSYVLSPDAGTGIWDGNWHNIVGTYDRSAVRLYVDGRQVGSGTADSAPISYGLSSSSDLVIGNYQDCANMGFVGGVDQVRVFDRVLDPREIDLGYRASRVLPPRFAVDLML